jgi:hypothetical protein
MPLVMLDPSYSSVAPTPRLNTISGVAPVPARSHKHLVHNHDNPTSCCLGVVHRKRVHLHSKALLPAQCARGKKIITSLVQSLKGDFSDKILGAHRCQPYDSNSPALQNLSLVKRRGADLPCR